MSRFYDGLRPAPHRLEALHTMPFNHSATRIQGLRHEGLERRLGLGSNFLKALSLTLLKTLKTGNTTSPNVRYQC